MMLVDLKPRWVGAGGEGISDGQGNSVPSRDGVGVSFDCPCGCKDRVYVGFVNPLDGGEAHKSKDQPVWTREGDTFEELTLTPSIRRVPVEGFPCNWHGFVTDGGIRTV